MNGAKIKQNKNAYVPWHDDEISVNKERGRDGERERAGKSTTTNGT